MHKIHIPSLFSLALLAVAIPAAAWAQDAAAGAAAPSVAPPAASDKPEFPNLLKPGTIAPDFTCVGADGKQMKLSDLRGKIVILDFWATWCVPCQKSMPHLERVYEQVKDKNVSVLALCVRDDEPAYEKWRVDHKADYTFPVAFDPAAKNKSAIYAAYGVPGIPTQYVIDKDGKVVAAYVGYMYKGDDRLESALAKVGVTVPAVMKTASK